MTCMLILQSECVWGEGSPSWGMVNPPPLIKILGNPPTTKSKIPHLRNIWGGGGGGLLTSPHLTSPHLTSPPPPPPPPTSNINIFRVDLICA